MRSTDGFQGANEHFIFLPLQQQTPTLLHVVAKVNNANSSTLVDIRQAATRAERDIPLSYLNSLTTYYHINSTGLDLVSDLFLVISLITLVLAISGIFGVLARSIIGQTQIVGIRRALGASKLGIFFLYLRKGLTFLLVGTVIGGGLAVITNNILFAQLIPSAPSLFIENSILVIGTLTIAIAVASILPTWKAVEIEPGDALRYE